MFKNKHVVVALIVAPILAVLAYFATGMLVGEKAQPAQAGKTYPLIAQPNCRYESGRCVFYNNTFKLTISPQEITDDLFLLVLESDYALQNVMGAVVQQIDDAAEPQPWQREDDVGKRWRLALPEGARDKQLLLVVDAQDSRYYGNTALRFLRYEPSFDKDFRQP
jgi:hypothetical protein